MAHFDGEAQGVVQAKPDGHLQKHGNAAADGIDALAAVDGHYFFIHFRFARIVHFVFFVAVLDGFDFRADALHFQRGFVAGDAQREKHHVDDDGENDDGPAPVGDVFVDPLEGVEKRVGDELHPAEIYEAVERRIHALEVVVIFGADVDAQAKDFAGRWQWRLGDRCGMSAWPLPARDENLSSSGFGACREQRRWEGEMRR